MQRFIYSLLLAAALPLILLRLFWRSLSLPAYRHRILERVAAAPLRLPAGDDPLIWIHAVSVGEVTAAAPLVEALLGDKPCCRIFITCTTPTGSNRVRELFQDRVGHSYMPYDLGILIRRFLRATRPKLLVLMETELWPNTIRSCTQTGVPVMLANARLSARSARSYARIAYLTRDMLQAIDCIGAQNDADAQRLIGLGARTDRVMVTGSLKFNMSAPNQDHPAPFLQLKGAGRPVISAGSTRSGEEELLLKAFRSVLEKFPDCLLILVPRHPERFDAVTRLCKERGFRCQRRSEGEEVAQGTQIWLGDSMGELLHYYACADIAFVGGSLVDTGCQNVLEPAALGLPVTIGSSRFNFAAICDALETAGNLLAVENAEALGEQWLELLADEDRRRKMGDAGLEVVAAGRNALPATLNLLQRLLPKES